MLFATEVQVPLLYFAIEVTYKRASLCSDPCLICSSFVLSFSYIMGQSDQKHVVVIAVYNLFFLLYECLLYKAVCQRDGRRIGQAHFTLLRLNSDLIEPHKSGASVLSVRCLFHPASEFDPASIENNSKFPLIPLLERRA